MKSLITKGYGIRSVSDHKFQRYLSNFGSSDLGVENTCEPRAYLRGETGMSHLSVDSITLFTTIVGTFLSRLLPISTLNPEEPKT